MRPALGGAALLGALIAIAGVSAPAQAAPSPCSLVSDWTAVRATDVTSYSIRESSRFWTVTEPEARERAAERVRDAYWNGTLATEDVSLACIPSATWREELMRTLGRVMFVGSMERLTQAAVPEFKELASGIEMRLKRLEIPLFAVDLGSAPMLERLGLGRKAGFHRSERSVMMGLDRIDPREWELIFVHEMAHWLDPKLQTALTIYGDAERAKRIAKLARDYATYDEVPRAAASELREFLMAGLDRGLLAEHRAWTTTLNAYESGVQAELWERLSWVDELLAQRSSSETLGHFVYRYLDPRFDDPVAEGLYALPLVREGLKRLRAELRNSP